MNQELYHFILNKEHHQYRNDFPEYENLAETFAAKGLSPIERMTERFELMTRLEKPVLLDGERICFMRTVKNVPSCFTDAEWAEIKEKHFIHELGYLSNLVPDYEGTLQKGLLAIRQEVDCYGARVIDALIDLSDRYCAEAEHLGKTDLAHVLKRVPRYGATSFYEALQFMRILHFGLWLEGDYHNAIGRFDQYMYPYLKADMDKGLYTKESALDLLEDFFLSFNKDSDLYPGVQQGDNGQSMVLGGLDQNGNDAFNLLSELCLKASSNLLMIDPKINLRVSKKTPLSIYELGSNLTKAGLGFPQYSNDDIVIDGLIGLGYDPKDAWNYAIAACWEFVIPKYGTDVVNIGALSFPKVIDTCFHRDLPSCDTFEAFMDCVKAEIQKEGRRHHRWHPRSLVYPLSFDELYDGRRCLPRRKI